MSPEGLLALAGLVLIGLGAAVIATTRSSPRVNGAPAESAGQLQPLAVQTGRVSRSSRHWIGIVLLAGGLVLLLIGAILLLIVWVLFGLAGWFD